ncbi:MAG: DUF2314 domain-containing protein [Proteobacteria bacterium]|nr:DUF2314 domain-containing protein [Pseudomonadota bacterium]
MLRSLLLTCLTGCCGLGPSASTPSDLPALSAREAPAGSAVDSTTWFEFEVVLPAKSACDAQARLTALLAADLPHYALSSDREALGKPGMVVFEPEPHEVGLYTEQELAYFAKGLAPEDFAAAAAADRVVVGVFDFNTLAIRDELAVVSRAFDTVAADCGGWIRDKTTRQMYTPAYAAPRTASLTSATPVAHEHIVQHIYENDGHVRIVSLGMQKFGLPDLVINGVQRSRDVEVQALVNGVAQALIDGVAVGDGGSLDLDVATLSATLMPRGEDASGKATLRLLESPPQLGDADNRLWEIDAGERDPSDRYAAQDRLYRSLYGDGLDDDVVQLEHDAVTDAARAKALARLVEMSETKAEVLANGSLQIKGPFPTTRGGTEWMWIEVTRWTEGGFTGVLGNDPEDVPGLTYGSIVTVTFDDVFDYRYDPIGGPCEGWITTRVLAEQQGWELPDNGCAPSD